MKPRLIALLLLLSGIGFGLAALALLTVATHLHPPSTPVLWAPELDLIIKDDLKLRQKLRDEENAANRKIFEIVGAHFQVCILLAVSGGIQFVSGLALLRGERNRDRPLL
jgi:hypothetical protein